MSVPYEVIDQLDDAQIDQLLGLYEHEWWTAGRRRDDVVRMLAGSDVVIGLVEIGSRRLLGFARVLTDRVYKALVLDVIVAPDRRGSGLGGLLMDTLVRHPVLVGVKHFELYCRPDMVAFYERWGFSNALVDLQFMRLTR